jgi:hypothetical protein
LRANKSHEVGNVTAAATGNRRLVVVSDIEKNAWRRSGGAEQGGLRQSPMNQQISGAKGGQVRWLGAAAVVH